MSTSKNNWGTRDKHQLLLAYTLGTPFRVISKAMNRSVTSLNKATARFEIRENMRQKRKHSKACRTHITPFVLQNFFKKCGLSTDPLFDKNCFIQQEGKIVYKPTKSVKILLKSLGIDPEEMALKEKNSVKIRKKSFKYFSDKDFEMSYQVHRRIDTYYLRDHRFYHVLRYLKLSGHSLSRHVISGKIFFRLNGKFYTPAMLVYQANRLREQENLPRLNVPEFMDAEAS